MYVYTCICPYQESIHKISQTSHVHVRKEFHCPPQNGTVKCRPTLTVNWIRSGVVHAREQAGISHVA